MAQLEVDLVAADRKVWSGAATQVSAPAADGEVGILAGHSPMLSVLGKGTVRVTPADGRDVAVGISGGFISVDDNAVTIVIDASDIDEAAVAAKR